MRTTSTLLAIATVLAVGLSMHDGYALAQQQAQIQQTQSAEVSKDSASRMASMRAAEQPSISPMATGPSAEPVRWTFAESKRPARV